MNYKIKVTKAMYSSLEWLEVDSYNDGCILDGLKVIGFTPMNDWRDGNTTYFLDEEKNKYFIYEAFVQYKEPVRNWNGAAVTRMAELPASAVKMSGAKKHTANSENKLNAIVDKMRKILSSSRAMITDEEILNIRYHGGFELEKNMRDAFAYGYYCCLIEMKDKMRRYTT